MWLGKKCWIYCLTFELLKIFDFNIMAIGLVLNIFLCSFRNPSLRLQPIDRSKTPAFQVGFRWIKRLKNER